MNGLSIISIVIGFSMFSALATDTGPEIDFAEYQAGVSSAVEDLSKKLIKYNTFASPRLIDDKLKEVAKESHGIDLIFNGCIRPPREDFHEGYHNTVLAYLKKKHRQDPVETLREKLEDARRANAQAGSDKGTPERQ